MDWSKEIIPDWCLLHRTVAVMVSNFQAKTDGSTLHQNEMRKCALDRPLRKLTYLIATSADGFVSRSDGSLDDFSFDGEHVQDLLEEYPETIPTHLRSQIAVSTELRHFDTVLMGRATYEVGSLAGFTAPYRHLQQYLFSSRLSSSPDDSVNLVSSQAGEVVRQLKSRDGLGIWLCGGPVLAASLIDQIDEVILKVNPFLMGQGKSIFSANFSAVKLNLMQRRDYTNGFSIVRYSLCRGA